MRGDALVPTSFAAFLGSARNITRSFYKVRQYAKHELIGDDSYDSVLQH